MPDATYTKLPGRSLNWTGLDRLWIAEDHLLGVSSLIAAERYARFPLRDIQALLIQDSRRFAIWGWTFGALLVLALLATAIVFLLLSPAIPIPAEARAAIDPILYGLAGLGTAAALVALTLLVIHLVKGPTCRCHLLTSSGRKPLGAPTRQKDARRLLPALTQRITEIQQHRP